MSTTDSPPQDPPAELPQAPQAPGPLHKLVVGLLAAVFLITPYLLSEPRTETAAVGHELVGDGLTLVTQHEALVKAQESGWNVSGTLESTWWGGIHSNIGFYRPLSSLTLGVAGAISGPYDPEAPGDKPIPYHLIALALNALCALLVLEVAWLLFRNRNLAFAAGALFACLPIHGEVLFDVAGIAELLCTALSLAAWAAWLHAGPRPFEKPVQLGLSLAFLFAATLAKESALFLPLVFVLMDLAGAREGGFADGVRHALSKFPALILCAVVLLLSIGLRLVVVGTLWPEFSPQNELDNPLLGVGAFAQFMNSWRLLGAGVLSMIGLNPMSDGWFNYSADYSLAQINALSAFSPWNLLSALGVLGSIGLAVALFTRCRTRAALWLAMFGAMLFTSNMFFPIGTIFADRLFFFPSVFLVLLIAASLHRLGRGAALVALVVAVLCGLWTRSLADPWKNPSRLWKHTVEQTASQSARAHYNAGVDLLRDNITSLATQAFERAIEIFPEYVQAHLSLGRIAVTSQDHATALVHYRIAADLGLEAIEYRHQPVLEGQGPRSLPDTIHGLGSLYTKEGRLQEYLDWLDEMLDKGYETSMVHHSRAEALRTMLADALYEGDVEAAQAYQLATEEAYERSLNIERSATATLSYGAYLRLQQRSEEALQLYMKIPLEGLVDPEYIEVMLARAETEFVLRDPESSLALVEDLLRTHGPLLGPRQRFRAKRFQALAKMELLSEDPTMARAQLREIANHYKSALAAFSVVREDTDDAHRTLIQVLFELGDYDEAQVRLETMLQTKDAPTQRFILGQIYERQGHSEDAREQYRQAADKLGQPLEDGSYIDEAYLDNVRNHLVRLTQALSGEEAVAEMIQGWHDLVVGEYDINGLYRSAIWRASLGDLDGALQDALLLVEHFPDDPRGEALRVNFTRFAELAAGLESGQATPDELLELTDYRLNHGDFTGAVEAGARALEVGAEQSDAFKERVLSNLADAHQAAGEHQAALARVNQALALPDVPEERRRVLQRWAADLEQAGRG